MLQTHTPPLLVLCRHVFLFVVASASPLYVVRRRNMRVSALRPVDQAAVEEREEEKKKKKKGAYSMFADLSRRWQPRREQLLHATHICCTLFCIPLPRKCDQHPMCTQYCTHSIHTSVAEANSIAKKPRHCLAAALRPSTGYWQRDATLQSVPCKGGDKADTPPAVPCTVCSVLRINIRTPYVSDEEQARKGMPLRTLRPDSLLRPLRGLQQHSTGQPIQPASQPVIIHSYVVLCRT